MSVFCHYNKISLIPFLHLCISLQRIRRPETDYMSIKSKDSKVFFTAQNSFIAECHAPVTSNVYLM